MGKEKLQPVANGLAGLKEAFDHLKLEMPRLDQELLQDPSRLDDAVEQKFTAITRVQESVTNALRWLNDVKRWLSSHTDKLKRKIAEDLTTKNMTEVREFVDNCLSCENPFFKTAAALSYLKHAFKRTFEDREEAMAMLADLENRNLLVKNSKGPIPIGYQRYRLGEGFEMDPEDLAKIQENIAGFSRSFLQLVHQDRTEKTEVMSAESDITLEQFKEGVPGKFLLGIPPECYTDRSGKEAWRGGGSILVQVQGKDVVPIIGVGSLEKPVETMAEMDVRLTHYTLVWETPPGFGKAFTRVKTGVMETRGLSEKEAEAYVKKMQALWYMIRRGLKTAEHQEEMDQLKEEWSKRADITPAQFYGLNGEVPKQGTALLKFNGGFKRKDKPSVYNLFFLVERTLEDDKDVIRIVDAPKHLKELLNSYMEKKYIEGEDFDGLPADLRRILRGIRGQVDMAVEVEAKE